MELEEVKKKVEEFEAELENPEFKKAIAELQKQKELDKLLASFNAELEKANAEFKKATLELQKAEAELVAAHATKEKASKKAEKAKLEKYKKIQQSTKKELLRGVGGSPGLVVGTVRVVADDPEKKAQIKPGEIYVADYATPKDNPYLLRAAAIVTNRGGRTCFAALDGMSWGIPTVVGTLTATQVLQDGQKVVVDGHAELDEKGRWIGIVYEYDEAKLEKHKRIEQSKGEVLLIGEPSAGGLAIGVVRVIDDDPEKKAQMKRGEVYVASYPTPEDYPHLKKAAAIVTNSGGRTSSAARAGNEWSIPAVVGTLSATEVLKDGQMVIVDGSEGVVYASRRKAPVKHEEQ